ncbi:protein COFACTOR ASSEMBLY OF COMPLEX C SUBUNIT B CCB3, chloroplastic [Rhodamnia argentea]|uniref:Protein COFACTOR ASSEMBLY OF COMPLEX C SUBUNIT B CCB3, chloroplastic n=1 Tax=Rhodamnia argentea TaxID=178133 RepID=A0A8B8PUC7_9MYRT|nr:protein COFACTOR ASSEMBLY OF COMPLEX C SUBUNIT B CCB3, chloroplastic [Rhodamnia argentea]
MAVCFSPGIHLQIGGCRRPLVTQPLKLHSTRSFKWHNGRKSGFQLQSMRCSACWEIAVPSSAELVSSSSATFGDLFDSHDIMRNFKVDVPKVSQFSTDTIHGLVIADLDPATAKLAIGILGPFLPAFAFLFILRIVMSWYPKLPVGKFPYVIAYAPTEPLLIPTRKLIPPLGGVDVTPVVWFGLVSFLNEILVGPQGLLVLLSQQVG